MRLILKLLTGAFAMLFQRHNVEDVRQGFGLGYPDHWPKRYNACTDPCDMLEGPCACGAWHRRDEGWVQHMIVQHGPA